MFDVIIIGAGIAGCSTARELARFNLSILVIEKDEDVAAGTTRANSGIVHGGYDPLPGTLKAHYNVQGSKMFPALAKDLGFGLRACGSLVVAFQADELPTLCTLLERGRTNNVEGLEILTKEALHKKEPNLSSRAIAALWVPSGAICNPYAATLAFAENAAENGVSFLFDTKVESVAAQIASGSEMPLYKVSTTAGIFEARCVVNAAGVYSDTFNNQVSSNHIEIHPRVGEYFLLDTEYGDRFTSTVFQCPSAQGKGVLVTPTTGGNLLIGPDSIPRDDPENTATTQDGLAFVLRAASKTWEHIPTKGVIGNFAGLRAHGSLEDFVIGEPKDAPRFYNIACFESPGLTAAPAVACDIAAQIAKELTAQSRSDFNPIRNRPFSFRTATNEQRAVAIAGNQAFGHIVCRCERVTEGEIVAAIHSPIPARTVDAIKWRTRAGMGRCQAGFCLPQVAEILARELNCPLEEVRKRAPGSRLLFGSRRQLNLTDASLSADREDCI